MMGGRSGVGRDNERGFTLIELLVVIIIIGILAAIAIPVFLNQRKKGYDAQAKSDLRTVAHAEETYLVDNPTGYGDAQSILTGGRFKLSPNMTVVVLGTKGVKGFCLYSHASASSSYYLWDNNAGGMNATTFTSAPTASTNCNSLSQGDTLSTATLTSTASGAVTAS